MPTDFAEVFGAAKKAPPEKPPPAPPIEKPPSRGEDISSVFARQPHPQTTKEFVRQSATVMKEQLGQAAGSVGKFLQPMLDTAVSDSQEYLNAFKADVRHLRTEPEVGMRLLRSLQTLGTGLSYVSSPVNTVLQRGLIEPLRKDIEMLGEAIKKPVTDPEKRKLVEAGVQTFQDAVEAAINAAAMMVGGEKAPPTRAIARTRAALRDTQTTIKPIESELKPVTASLDKTMGFQKVVDNTGKTLHDLPVGSTRSAASIVDDMLPHAEGYAKGFLQKLAEHVDPKVQVRFREVAGSDPANLGVYNILDHAVTLKAGAHDMVHTAIHEIVHSSTVNMLDTLMEGDLKRATEAEGRELLPSEKLAVLNNPSSPIVKELDAIIKEARVRQQKAGRDFYGLRSQSPQVSKDVPAHMRLSYTRMSPRYEFVAELFSNTEFQEFLANSEKYASAGYKWKNMLNQLGNLIGRHLGITQPGELRLLNQSMRTGMRLIEMQAKEKPPSMRGIYQVVARTEEGGTITRGDIAHATPDPGRLIDTKEARRAKDSLKISIEQLIRTFNPEALGEKAKLAAAAIASRIVELNQKQASWRYGSETRLKFWRGRPDMTAEFIEKFERGEKFSDPILQKLADKYRDWGQRIADNDKKLGFDYEPRDNYLSHIFEDEEGVQSYFTRKYGSKWGDPSFIKDRTFDLYKEAIAAGFRPRFDNPEDIMLARQHAADLAEMQTSILNDLASYGLATRKIEASEKLVKTLDAEGKVRLDIVKTPGTERPEGTERWRAPNGDVFWVDHQADAILQNAFKSKSLWGDKGLAGTAFKGMMFLKNSLVPIRLALSLFHPLHVVGIDVSAGMTRGLAGMLSGAIPPHRALGQMLTDGLGSFRELPGIRSLTNAPGWEVMKAWRGQIPKESLSPENTKALETLIEMGVAPEMSSQYRTNARQNFRNALIDARANFRMRSPVGAAGDLTRATWHLPWALISAMQKPIFEQWIPQLKAASALKDAKNILMRSPELMENDAARHLVMRKLGKSVENRYGEMNYSTLFWKRWMKDIAVLDTLSLGWQLGFIREYGGGAMDLGQWAKGGDRAKQIRMGKLDRPIFVASYTTLGAGVAGLMTWAMTGEPPSSLLDYISPRTGEKNPDGTDQRVSTMFYSREFAALYKHMQNEGVVPGLSQLVLNKGSGMFGLMHEWATGVNGFGQEIRNPEADVFKQLEQTLAYTLSDIEPISMKAIHDQITENPVKGGVLTALGFTPAPKYLTETKTEASIKTAFRSYVAPKETPFERAEYSKEYTKLREAYQTGSEDYGNLLDDMTEKYQLSGKDQRRMIRSLNSGLPSNVRMFMRLPWEEQGKLLDKMTPEERDVYLPHANREHIRNRYVPPENRE